MTEKCFLSRTFCLKLTFVFDAVRCSPPSSACSLAVGAPRGPSQPRSWLIDPGLTATGASCSSLHPPAPAVPCWLCPLGSPPFVAPASKLEPEPFYSRGRVPLALSAQVLAAAAVFSASARPLARALADTLSRHPEPGHLCGFLPLFQVLPCCLVSQVQGKPPGVRPALRAPGDRGLSSPSSLPLHGAFAGSGLGPSGSGLGDMPCAGGRF